MAGPRRCGWALLFVLAVTVAGLLRPGYSPVDQAISDLGIAEDAWIVNGSLVILGLSLTGFVISFSRSIRPRSPMALRAATAALLASPATLVLVGLTFSTFSFYEFTGGPSPVGQYGGLMDRPPTRLPGKERRP